MPSTAVYFEALPSLIALIAAFLMLSGVSKSGSPTPRPITSRPAAFSARAWSVTAMVGDGLMRLSESARKAMGISACRVHCFAHVVPHTQSSCPARGQAGADCVNLPALPGIHDFAASVRARFERNTL